MMAANSKPANNKITISSHEEIPLALHQALEHLLAVRGYLWGHAVTTQDETVYQQVKQAAALIARIQKEARDV